MSEQPELKPEFVSLRGAMGGYSQATNRVCKKNLQALFDEMQASNGLMDRASDLTWDEVWRTINHFQEFWARYYAGQHREVQVEITPKPTWPQYLADKAKDEAAFQKTRIGKRSRVRPQVKE